MSIYSFTDFLNKFEYRFGTETLNMAKLHTRSWKVLVYCYVHRIPIHISINYNGCYVPSENIIEIARSHSPISILTILCHEVSHAQDFHKIKFLRKIVTSKSKWMKFILDSEVRAMRNTAKALIELESLTRQKSDYHWINTVKDKYNRLSKGQFDYFIRNNTIGNHKEMYSNMYKSVKRTYKNTVIESNEFNPYL